MGDFAQYSIYGYATSWLSPNFGFAETSYILEPLVEIGIRKEDNNGYLRNRDGMCRLAADLSPL